jgi:hypothetical protein
MSVLPTPLDANVNNPTMFSVGGKKRRTPKRRTTIKRKYLKRKYFKNRKTNNNKYCARICVSKRNISMGYTIDKQKLQ